ncbi:MAG: hypothetical protein ABJA74_11675 [Lapillicoccus sp.]
MGDSTGKPVGKQSARQLARRAALDAQATMRARRVERDKRLSELGVQVMMALGERDELVARCERRAGEALRGMTQDEGLGLAEAVQWCGETMTRREATRMRALVDSGSRSEPVTAAAPSSAKDGQGSGG